MSLDTAKVHLGIDADSDAEDSSIQLWLDIAHGIVSEELGRDIVSGDYPGAADDGRGDSGYYLGDNTRVLLVKQRPVTAVSSVWYDPTGYFGDNPDGAFATATLLVYGTDYVPRWDGCLPGTTTQCSYAGMIERINGVWPSAIAYTRGQLVGQYMPGRGNIKIAYTAGYTATNVPTPIRGAVLMLLAKLRREAQAGGPMSSESLGGYSYSMASAAAQGWPEMGSVRQMLGRYREVVL